MDSVNSKLMLGGDDGNVFVAQSNTLCSTPYHVPVLYEEVLASLDIQKDGVYVDCTFGGGGHSRGILGMLGEKGRLIAFDHDGDAAIDFPQEDKRVLFIHENFRYIQRYLRLHKIPMIDGVVADLGVSSHQFDTASRGFSIRYDGPLDMRMDTRTLLQAKDIVQTYSVERLQEIFGLYGEVSNAKSLARHIVESRVRMKMDTIQQFSHSIHPVVLGNPNKYLAQVFQALRIEVNQEMESLRELLEQLPSLVKKGGRVSIITFHSVEDKLVKSFLGGASDVWGKVTKKPILPNGDELVRNPRSRSAKLRVAERL